MLEMFIVAIIFLFFNFILIVKRVPLISLPIAIFTIYITVMVFLKDTTIPANPYFSFFIILIAVINLLSNVADFNLPNKGGK